MNPGFASDGFRDYTMSLQSREFSSLIRCVTGILESIDVPLGYIGGAINMDQSIRRIYSIAQEKKLI